MPVYIIYIYSTVLTSLTCSLFATCFARRLVCSPQLATDKAAAEGIPFEEAHKYFANNGAITIRQVTSMERSITTRDGMKNRYKFKNYPEEFKFRCKCLVVFQEIDAVDVMLFGLYVYEHDKANPKPNTRAVYVSYLDSVHYMQPRKIRTFIYHELLIAYLDYVRHRGFATAHIWACPPLKGDDYILYAKPEDQRTPKDQQLRQWYIDMLDTCQKRGIVKSVTNMYDLYFANPENDATIVPYLEGDYWVGEAENIIKELEDGPNGKKVRGAPTSAPRFAPRSPRFARRRSPRPKRRRRPPRIRRRAPTPAVVLGQRASTRTC